MAISSSPAIAIPADNGSTNSSNSNKPADAGCVCADAQDTPTSSVSSSAAAAEDPAPSYGSQYLSFLYNWTPLGVGLQLYHSASNPLRIVTLSEAQLAWKEKERQEKGGDVSPTLSKLDSDAFERAFSSIVSAGSSSDGTSSAAAAAANSPQEQKKKLTSEQQKQLVLDAFNNLRRDLAAAHSRISELEEQNKHLNVRLLAQAK